MGDTGILLAGLAACATLAVAGLATWNLRLFRRAPEPAANIPRVSVLIPARNEAAGIEAAVRAACAQEHAEVEVVVLDDGSTDATRAILEHLRRDLPALRVATGSPLPRGWAGKAWACWQLASEHARHDWLLFADADVELAPDAAARMAAAACAHRAEFVSAFPRQRVGGIGEALIVPLIYLVLLCYLPFARIRRDPRPSLSAGCGQLMLAQRNAYRAAGGHEAIRGTRHDGIMLARRMKAAGFAIAVLDGFDIATCRMYEGLRATWLGFAKNAYEALGSPIALVVMIVLNVGLFVVPFVAFPWALVAGDGSDALFWGLSTAIVLALRSLLIARFDHPWWTVLTTPVAVILLVGIYLHSFAVHRLGRSVTWRGRAYPGDLSMEER